MYFKFLIQCFLIFFYFISSVISNEFDIYWNIPSFMCRRYNTKISNITKEYDIKQNFNDNFRGNHITILYDPGNFPAIIQNETTNTYIYRNHGIPQNADINDHLKKFENDLNHLIPDKNFSGLGIIDFELWRPIYRQNFGILNTYKDLSTFIERQKHPFWNDHRINTEATKQFEKYAKNFILETLQLAKKLRPFSKWGYYGLPFCFNGRGQNIEDCPNYVKKENDGMQWLIDESDIVLPSVYLHEDLKYDHRVPMVKGRIKESIRMAENVKNTKKPKVYVYYRYLFADTLRYLSESEAFDILTTIRKSGADGVILWGSSNDLNTRDKCNEFYKYLTNTLGPILESLQPTYTVESPSNNIDD